VSEQAVLLGEGHLRWPVQELVEYYHLERNRQGLGHRLITSALSPANDRARLLDANDAAGC
jgi:hypothetical protein